jgi:hypothetical protein
MAQNLVREGEVLVILMPGKKGFWNAVMACILLRNNFQNSIPACSVTKLPLGILHKSSNMYHVFNKLI